MGDRMSRSGDLESVQIHGHSVFFRRAGEGAATLWKERLPPRANQWQPTVRAMD